MASTVQQAASSLAKSSSMPSLFENPAQFYSWILSFRDPVSRGYPVTDNPLVVLAIVAAYLITIWLLVAIMSKKEKPLDVYYLALFHNINMTALSAYMCIETIRCAFLNNFGIWGNYVDSTNPHVYKMANVMWLFYISKTFEFLDTVIMALKKNFHQISFLHLYHHGSIFFVQWITFYYGPGGEAYFSCMLNSLVHVVMYGYYLWATFARKLNPGEKPSVFHPGFYRPYITRMQMIQFACNFAQASYGIIMGGNAVKYPQGLYIMLWVYMITMLGLFANFYRKAYSSKGKKGSNKEE